MACIPDSLRMDSCKNISRLVSAGLDRKLGAVERLRVRLHLLFCAHCTNVDRHLKAIRIFMKRLAERGREDGGADAPAKDS
jgi:Putative zinc-finger